MGQCLGKTWRRVRALFVKKKRPFYMTRLYSESSDEDGAVEFESLLINEDDDMPSYGDDAYRRRQPKTEEELQEITMRKLADAIAEDVEFEMEMKRQLAEQEEEKRLDQEAYEQEQRAVAARAQRAGQRTFAPRATQPLDDGDGWSLSSLEPPSPLLPRSSRAISTSSNGTGKGGLAPTAPAPAATATATATTVDDDLKEFDDFLDSVNLSLMGSETQAAVFD